MKKSLTSAAGKTVAPYVAPPLQPPCAEVPCEEPSAYQVRQVGTGAVRYLCEGHRAHKWIDEVMTPLKEGEPKEGKPRKVGRPEKPKPWRTIS